MAMPDSRRQLGYGFDGEFWGFQQYMEKPSGRPEPVKADPNDFELVGLLDNIVGAYHGFDEVRIDPDRTGELVATHSREEAIKLGRQRLCEGIAVLWAALAMPPEFEQTVERVLNKLTAHGVLEEDDLKFVREKVRMAVHAGLTVREEL